MVEKLHSLANLPGQEDSGEGSVQSKADLSGIVQAHEDWLDSKGRAGERADLEEGRLLQANLSGTRLRGANARRARMVGANLEAADLTHCTGVGGKETRVTF